MWEARLWAPDATLDTSIWPVRGRPVVMLARRRTVYAHSRDSSSRREL